MEQSTNPLADLQQTSQNPVPANSQNYSSATNCNPPQSISQPPTQLTQEAKAKNPILKYLLILIALLIISSLGLLAWQYYLKPYLTSSEGLSFLPLTKPSPSGEVSQPIVGKEQKGIQYQSVSQLPLAHNSFGFDIFKELLATEEKGKNIFISPSSIALALSMTYNGAEGETKEAMAKTMHIAGLNLEELNKVSSQLMTDLQKADPKVEIAIANSIWAEQSVRFKPEFRKTNENYYGAKIEAVDFSQGKAIIDMINSWVSNKTKGKIPTILEDLDWLVCLLNAIYFKGTWTYEFNKNLTQEKDLTLFDQSIKKHPLMKQKREDFSYLENNDFQAVNLPYGENKRLSMYVFLPKNNLENFLTKLTIDNWSKWIKEFKEMEGTLLLPKFKIEYDKELKEILFNLGMGIAFGGGANFSNMTDRGLFIDRVIHKTFVEVDEKGTEAAAVTAVLMKVVAAPGVQTPPTFYMEVNKPFFFAIVDNETGEILFMGVIKEPKN